MKALQILGILFGAGILLIVGLLGFVRGQYPVNQWIVFTSDRNGQFDLYMVRVDGAEINQLTTHPQRDSHPNWSSNGAWIVFESNRSDNHNWDIFRIRPNGKSLKQLTTSFNIERFPYWDIDKTSIIYKQNYQATSNLLIRMDANGKPLANQSFIKEYVNSAPSPNGKYLAREVYGNYQVLVVVYDVATDETIQLTQHNGRDDNPAWSPDGEWLAFESNQDGNWEIYVMRYDGTDLRRLTYHSAEDHDPSWSPDLSKSWHPLGLTSLSVILNILLIGVVTTSKSNLRVRRFKITQFNSIGKW